MTHDRQASLCRMGRRLPAFLATLALLFLLVVPAGAQGAAARDQPTALLAAETPAQTPWFVVKAKRPGPTVLIVGGMHGNEPAGASAAEQIASWTIKKGTLVIVPRANVLALDADRRRTPGLSGDAGDLNRHFPIGGDPTPGIAQDIWKLLEEVQPDWVLDLHEGFDFHRTNDESVGSSVIACVDERALELARKMIAVVDGTIVKEGQRFDLLRNPVPGSLARAAWENTHIPALIVETTSKEHVLSYRVRQHRLLVHTFLTELGLGPCAPTTVLGPDAARDRVRVAVFDGSGTGKGLAAQMASVLAEDPACVVRRVGSHDVRAGVLSQFDVVVHPGGSGSGQAKALGKEGRRAEIDFVRGGGGYLGVCAGAYLAACNYDWSLGVIDARVIDREHWRRGVGAVDVEWSEGGCAAIGAGSTAVETLRFPMQYANGPILMPAKRGAIPDYIPLLVYRGEIAENGASKGVMPGTAAVVRGTFGRGRAVVFSPHPEKTTGLHALLHNSLRWLAGQDP